MLNPLLKKTKLASLQFCNFIDSSKNLLPVKNPLTDAGGRCKIPSKVTADAERIFKRQGSRLWVDHKGSLSLFVLVISYQSSVIRVENFRFYFYIDSDDLDGKLKYIASLFRN